MRAKFLLLFFFPILLFAQVQSPKAFLGYELGEKFTRHHQVVSYYEHVAETMDNVNLMEYGRTYENRPLLLAFVSSKENIDNLEQIREDNLRRAGLIEGTPSTDVSIVWLSYNVHGNEASSSEASMATIYELIREGSDKAKWLENTVVIIDPCINPDGRDRYVNFFWEHGNQPYNPDPNSIEHRERAPWGRSNHYLFDLNRDWAWMTQVETQSRMKVYNQWLPHVHVDFHEQFINSPYYFAPAAQPYHELVTPFQREFQDKTRRNHAKYFDENNWLYFTKEVFDLLYPSYGDTYPIFNGAIGMTYEQAGHGTAGLGIIKQEGDSLTLKDRIAHHYTTGLSTIEVSSNNTDQLLSEFGKYFGNKPSLKYKTFVLKYDGNDDKFEQLRRWLDAQEIRYGVASNAKGLRGFNYATRSNSSFSISEKDLVISMDQPKATLAHILFEPKTRLVDSVTYDLTAWGVPYAYGINAYASEQLLPVQEYEETMFQSGEVPNKVYAFVSKWNSIADAKFLSVLLKNNVKVRFTERTMTYKGKTFEKGSVIIAKRDNKKLDSFEELITQLANQNERTLTPVNSGYMDSGPDLGSGNVRYLKKPKIAIVRGDDVSSLSYGAVWHFMEQELSYPSTMLGTNYLSGVDLSNYDVIVMPDGRYSSLDESLMQKISNWVSSGGKLIAFQGALGKFKDSDYSSLATYNSDDEKSKMERISAKRAENAKLVPYEKLEREGAKNLALAIFQVKVDNTHPLAFGYPSTYYTIKTRPNRVAYLNGGNVGVIEGEQSVVSGFSGAYVTEDLKKTLAFGVERKGAGQIVYFTDDPLFRSFWQNAKLLFVNALFMVGQ